MPFVSRVSCPSSSRRGDLSLSVLAVAEELSESDSEFPWLSLSPARFDKWKFLGLLSGSSPPRDSSLHSHSSTTPFAVVGEK